MKVPERARRYRPRALPALAVVAALVAALLPAGQTAAQAGLPDAGAGEPKVAPALEQRFARADHAPQDFWVRFGTRADLSAAPGIDDWVERGEYVVQQLRETATTAQAATIDLLDQQGVRYESYWAANAIRVEGGSYRLASHLAQRPEVAQLLEPVRYERPDPTYEEPDGGELTPQAVEWGLANINADDVWQQGIDGSGIVIASIDSGVQFDHPALVNQYRGNNGNGSFTHDYNWFDASGNCDGAPCDTNGHGTHTMGALIGSDGGANQIGVAPGATWITANGCHTCSRQDLMDSAQWLLNPTKLDGTGADPAMRPNIINNSWGTSSPSVDPFFDQIAQTWAASGIFAVFANGNRGPNCQSASSPGSRTISYSVGAYDRTNTIASFSARGSGQDGEIKPNISAPGVDVRSAYPGSRYAIGEGTSMAAPHVAGAIGLLWSAAPDLVGNIQATRDLLDVTAVDTEDLQCGGDAEDNNVYGEGRLDVAPMVAGHRVGVLDGRVASEDTGAGIAGARIRIVGGSADHPIDRTVGANAAGDYRAGLPIGEYEVTASAYGYLPRTTTVTITEGDTISRDFSLSAAPTVTVTGQVRDGSGQGWPLYAEVVVDGYPGDPVFTDPVTGEYSVELMAAAEYTLTIDPVYEGYPSVIEPVEVGEDDVAFDHPMAADLAACVAPGYAWNGLDTTFDGWTGETPQDGWRITGRTGSWRFDNPQHRQPPRNALGSFPLADPAGQPKGRLSSTLTSPPIDLTGHVAPQLMLDMRYLGAPKHQRASIEYSTDGRAWWPVWSATATNTVGVRTFPLPQAAGQADVQLRFSFTGRSDDTYWGFDNVFVGTRECLPQAGGLLVGEASDAATGEGLVNTRVWVRSDPDGYVRSRPVDDPARPGALYWLFAPGEGPDQLEARAAHYDPFVTTVTVTPHEITHQDIELSAAAAASPEWR